MLLAYTGTPGSGKSYHAVKEIWDRIKYGHPVITNIELDVPDKYKPYYHYYDVHDITPHMLEQFSNEYKVQHNISRVREEYIYLVIDEAQLVFNCREWSQKGRADWVSFFTRHRKYGYHIILITQMVKMLDNQCRGLLEYEVLHRKFSSFGLKGLVLSLVLLSPTLFACVRLWAPINEKIDSEVIRYSGRIGRLYNTAQTYEKETPVEP